jgi:tetratricopeptide (TPR) repeat protein
MATPLRLDEETATRAGGPTKVGAVSVALAHAFRLLRRDPAAAQLQAEAILEVEPDHPGARLALGAAALRLGAAGRARAVLADLVKSHPGWAEAHHELGLARARMGDAPGAVTSLRRAVALNPNLPEAWGALADQLLLSGDGAGADQAYAGQIRASATDPELMNAAVGLCEGRLDVAEAILRRRLKARPTDVPAIRMLAEIATRLGRYADAETLLTRCLELAPSFAPARHHHAVVLYRQGRAGEAAAQIGQLLRADPANPAYRTLQAAALAQIGDYDQAITVYEGLLAEHPEQAKVWLSYGHALKTAGRQGDCIAAYRRAIAASPGFGEAYWSLANLKTVPMEEADIGRMRAHLARTDLPDDDRLHLCYALGKALEDRGDFAAAFEAYGRGARIRRGQVAYHAEETTAQVARTKAVFTAERLARTARPAAEGPAPIFIVGLPRSGSTLIEQILSSHSAVEGTMELPEIGNIVKTLRQAAGGDAATAYPHAVAGLDVHALAELGQRYLEKTRIYRKLGRPLFIDKMPNNFQHVGLIHLILPNAKIIDARRHPLATCLSAFKQHFARGQHFSYGLEDLGHYYRDYVDVMDHFDRVLPGRIHRVEYERMVTDFEPEVRRLLDYCELSFEPACLRFHENDRAVRTASSEQVRLPIFREGLDHWRNFEPWLGPLKAALGPGLGACPEPGRAVAHVHA